MSAVEKGSDFERELMAQFKREGYEVSHNIRLTGKSGVVHQIDLIATYDAPLHKSTILIEAKDHLTPIGKDAVIKLASIREDLSMGHAILITTSGFTPSALKTAAMYENLELWDGQKTANIIMDFKQYAPREEYGETPEFPMAVSTKFNEFEIRAMVMKEWMGNRKFTENISDIKILWLPHYDVDLSAKITVVEKTGWFSKEAVARTVEAKVTFDANTGVLLFVDKDGLSYKYATLADLDGDQRSLLRVVGKDEFEKRSMTLRGVGPNKVGQKINDMAGKGAIVQTRMRPATYKATSEYPYDPRVCGSIGAKWYPRKIDVGAVIAQKIDPGEIIELVSTYWNNASVNSMETIYYPYYIVTIKNEEGTERTISVDGVTKTRCEELE